MDEETPQADEAPQVDTEALENDSQPAASESEANVEPDAFDREYVAKLRKESAGYRDKAKTAEAKIDELSKRLHTALVAATGRLQDPSDLPYAAEHVDDPEALKAAIDELLNAKPHLKSRRVSGDAGQGNRGDAHKEVSLLEMLRGR